MNLAESLDSHGRSKPEKPAIIAGTREIPHGELAAWVRNTAAALLDFGCRPGDLVGVCLKDSPEHLVAYYALARMGGVIVPMDWRWSEGEKERVAGHFGLSVVLVEEDAAPVGTMKQLTFRELSSLSRDGGEGEMRLEADLPLLLSLSSGTTGRPKGPRITHHQMLRRFWTHWIDLGLNSGDRYLSATPLFFGGGRTFAMSVLFAGGTVILFPPNFRAKDLPAEVERTEATSLFLVPTQLRKLLELSPEQVRPMQRLRLLISSGSPLDPPERHTIRERLCANFVEYYASTEGGGISISTPATQRLHSDSVGRPIFGVEVGVADADDRALPPGTVGRLRYRGPGVAQGYYNDDDESRSAFFDGWFYPGDLAEINEAGYIFLRGRSKDMILRNGVNIYPAEIETVLRAHPQVVESAVVGRPAPGSGEEVCAFVTTCGDIDAAALMQWCRERLAPYKVPSTLVMLDELPRSSVGKILKSALLDRLRDGADRR